MLSVPASTLVLPVYVLRPDRTVVPPALMRRKLPPPERTPENVCVPMVLPPCNSFDLRLLPVPVVDEMVIGNPKLKPLPVNDVLNTVLPVDVFIFATVSEPLVPTTLL